MSDSYAQELYDQDLFITEIDSPSEASLDDRNPGRRSLPPSPSSVYDSSPGPRNAYKFFNNLQRIDIDELPDDERSCEVCLEAYGTDDNDSTVVQLSPCGHRFGMDCIVSWLSPTNIPNKNTCPKCRAVLFEIDEPKTSDMEDGIPGEEDIMAEVVALIRLRSLESFPAAIAFLEPFFRDEIPLPAGFLYTRQALALYLALPDYRGRARERTNIALYRQLTERLAAIMGQLHARFADAMEAEGRRFPWPATGPSIMDLLNPEMHDSLMLGLLRIVDIESELLLSD